VAELPTQQILQCSPGSADSMAQMHCLKMGFQRETVACFIIFTA